MLYDLLNALRSGGGINQALGIRTSSTGAHAMDRRRHISSVGRIEYIKLFYLDISSLRSFHIRDCTLN